METALHSPCPATQPREGVGLRLARRIGGAVRSVVSRGIALAGGCRQTAEAQPDPRMAPAPSPTAPSAPKRATPPRRKRGGMSRREVRRFLRRLDGDTPFTPEAFPGMSPEACAFFNTPLEECDPAMVEASLAALAQLLAPMVPAEAGMGDADAVLTYLWGRVGGAFPPPATDAPAEPEPAAAIEPTPDAPASPDMQPRTMLSAADEAAPETMPALAATLPQAQLAIMPLRRALALASAMTPVSWALTWQAGRENDTASRRGLPFSAHRKSARHLIRWLLGFCRAACLDCTRQMSRCTLQLSRCTRRALNCTQRCLRPRHVCYAARASPC